MWIALLAATTSPATADSCPNAAVRAQNNSTHLPDCRAYEQVTNPFKEGFAPAEVMYTDDGDALAYKDPGQFAGNDFGGTNNQYVATRSAAGWLTTSPTPSSALWSQNNEGSANALSGDLRSSIWATARADQNRETVDFYRRDPDGAFTLIGPGFNHATLDPGSSGGVPQVRTDDEAATADLSHLIFLIQGQNAFPGILPGTSSNLYEYVGAGNDRPTFVGVDSDGNQVAPGCPTFAGSRNISAYRAMSTDGRVIFWSANCVEMDGGLLQLWARVNATTTYHVSASQCTRAPSDPGGACNAPANAEFQGAGDDGTRAYFTSPQQLVNGDTDATSDLYACDIPPGTPAPVGVSNPCAPLSEVSGAATGADVQGVVRVSEDGSRVYFVAHGVLAANHGANDTPAVAGDDNLYVWRKDATHPTGQTTFVGKLDPSDNGMWGSERAGRRPAQTTHDGRYLVLSTRSPLVGDGENADTDDAADVYRYDADTGAFLRLSTAASGQGGNANGLDATLSGIFYNGDNAMARARTFMTDDAGTVVFRSSEALSPADTNGIVDIYAWHDGRVSLISGGQRSLDDQVAVPTVGLITPSGRDIYFSTTVQLTSTDGDTQVDFYDARVDGGFAAVAPPRPCSGDACQGAPNAPPGPGSTASDTTAGPSDVPQTTPTFSLQTVSAAARKRLASNGKITLRVTANTPATLSAKATATIKQKMASVGSARRTLAGPGTASLTLALSKAARAQLAADGRLTVKILVSDSEVAVTRSVSLKLTHAKAKKAGKGTASERSSQQRHAAGLKGGRS